MKKQIAFFVMLALILAAFSGCSGTPVVYYSDCTCPTGSHEAAAPAATAEAPAATEAPAVSEGAVKTGLSVSVNISDSAGASAEAEGVAKYDITLVAVTVDDSGVITGCAIDSIGTQVNFDQTGAITTDLTADVLSKNELGENYGMKAVSQIGLEWNEQAAGLAGYAVGKTVEELKTIAIDESGYAADVDLASTASINLFSYIYGIEAAVNNAQYLGAQAGDTLRLAAISSLSDSTGAAAEADGNAQLNVDVTALTMNGDVITSCYIDSVQAKVAFDTAGTITTDLTAPVQTKNQLGERYGLKAMANSRYEWNEQAAAFAEYVTGKTAAGVAGIAVDEGTKPTDADLASTVTIAIGGFQALIAKAAK